MEKNTFNLLANEFGISEKTLKFVQEAENEVSEIFGKLDEIAQYNQYKVLAAFQKNKVSDIHFAWNTGYGYNDVGREIVEKVYADIFKTEAALVRPLIVSGTHALSLTLCGVLRPGDELIYVTGRPYDTLEEVIGIRGKGAGSLKEFGISYKQVELCSDGQIDLNAVKNAVTDKTKMISIQRATGYSERPAISLESIEKCAKMIKSINPDIVMMADNCYGEFLDIIEPTEIGIDVMAGSLIKNPGGGLALSGGYIVGRTDLIEKISYRMTSPGIGNECGLMFGQTRSILQGLFIAPKTVNAALKGAVLCAKVFEKLGYEVFPSYDAKRSDIIEAVKLKSEEALCAFAEGIQKAAPIDAHVVPLPWDMPGYEDKVIMAAGAFVQGSSIELSADGPLREPYTIYFQGGLTYEHSKFGVIKALDNMVCKKIVNI
ncbi:MAG: aminotransferase class I/II-fold pyridoxal phosphate-dependent enzyme [Eubacteriales bacterium]